MDVDIEMKQRMSVLDEKRKKLEEKRKLRESHVRQDNNNADSLGISTSLPLQDPKSSTLPMTDNEGLTLRKNLTEVIDSVSISPEEENKITYGDQQTYLTEALKLQGRMLKCGLLKTFNGVAVCNIMPLETFSYDKGTETDLEDDFQTGASGDIDVYLHRKAGSSRDNNITSKSRLAYGSTAIGKKSSVVSREGASVIMDRHASGTVLKSNVQYTNIEADGVRNSLTNVGIHRQQLSEHEIKDLVSTSDFKGFLENSSFLIESQLRQQESVMMIKKSLSCVDETTSSPGTHKLFLKTLTFIDKNVVSRSVLDIQSSSFQTELFIASYGSVKTLHKTVESVNEETPACYVYVWSIARSQTPVYRFTASSPVTSANFHTLDPHLIVGGCYSGQILLWDMRCKERPVQRSSMSRQRGHSHPIVSMSMAGMSPESREMMSVCTGGTVCTWDVSRMNEPVTSMMISLPTNEATLFSQTNTLDSLRVSSCAYAYEGDRDAFHSIILGNEIGRLYSINMPYRQIDPVIQISAHQGLITSIDMHPSRLPCYKNLFLTSSFDCSVKLWNLEVHDKPIVEINSSSFDYIVDVKWSPIGPSIFGMITSAGQLQIWDLSTSTTCPHDSIQLLHDTAGEEGNNRKLEALNKMKWSLDGRQIMVGGSRGAVFAVLIAIEAARSRPENIESFKKLIDPLPT